MKTSTYLDLETARRLRGERERDLDLERERFCRSATRAGSSSVLASVSSSWNSTRSSTMAENRTQPVFSSLTTKTKGRSAVTTVSASGSGMLTVSMPRAPTSMRVL
jgi:hypothetical protein